MLNIKILTARLHLQIWTVDVEDWRIGADWRFISRKTLSLRNTPILTSMTGDLAPETQKWFFFQAEESSKNVLYFYYYCSGVNLFLASGTQKWFLYQAEKSSRNFILLLYWHKGLNIGSSIRLRSAVGILLSWQVWSDVNLKRKKQGGF